MINFLMAVSLVLHIQCSHINKHDGTKVMDRVACSAVFVSPTEALTAAHCVEETTGHMWVKDSDNKSFSASVEKLDTVSDLCLLKVNGPKHKYVKLGDTPDIGDKVYMVSNEMDIPGTYCEGIVNNLFIDPDMGTPVIMHSAVMMLGASGSGLFDKKGRLIGINDYIIRSISFATDVSVIKIFLTK